MSTNNSLRPPDESPMGKESRARSPLMTLRNAVKRTFSSTSLGQSSKTAKLARKSLTPKETPPKHLPSLAHLMHIANGWEGAEWEQQHVFAYMLSRQVMLRPPGQGYCISVNPDITDSMRCKLVDWLGQVSFHLQLMPETWSRGIQLLDMFTNVRSVPTSDYQLLGVSALWIAAKIEERYVPALQTLVDLGDDTYTEDDLAECERAVLSALDFDVNRPEPVYIVRFLVDWAMAENTAALSSMTYRTLLHTALYACALCMQQPRIYRSYTAAQVAVASVLLASRVRRVMLPCGVHKLFGDCSLTLQLLVSHMATLLREPRPYSMGIKAWFARTRFDRIALDKHLETSEVIKTMADGCDLGHLPVVRASSGIRASEGEAYMRYSSSDVDDEGGDKL